MPDVPTVIPPNLSRAPSANAQRLVLPNLQLWNKLGLS